MKSRNLLLVLAACGGIAACNAAPPPPSATLDSGVSASNGGGQRALGNLPNVGVTNGQTTVTTRSASPSRPAY